MAEGFVQIAIFFALIVAITPLLGGYMARVFRGERTFLDPVAGPIERATYRLLRIDPERGQDWKAYARSALCFSFAGWLLLYVILLVAAPQPWDLAFNTASSFVTNTNWQYYAGETISAFSQMTGLAVQNFVSAATGIAVAVALIRGIAARRSDQPQLGNFWRDLVRTCLWILLPISIVAAVLLVSQGVLQSLGHPVASQEAIKELGTNGGGYFNVNSAHPFENPTAFSNLLELLLILSIPAALTATYGRMVGSRRQGWALFGAMSVLFAAGVVVVYLAEMHGTPAQHAAGISGANMEGKEVRFGISGSALWTAVTTVTSCGAVNAGLESLTGIGGLVPMVNMSYGESVFGGVGTGLYTMLLYVLLAVFIGGLMVGRTPEFMGKKVEAREIKLVSLGVLVTPLAVLLSSALAIGTTYGRASIFASGPQGFSETFYAYLSQANNNGSAFAGYTGVTFADLLGGVVMLGARFAPIVLVLAVAGSLATKRVAPAGLGTLRTDTPTFVGLLGGVVVLIGALTFFPALLLGPVVQGMTDRLF
jgi:potassium-transporting ATPase potassium-binding subunit